MLPDIDRQLVHNEYLRAEMLADRCMHDSPVDTLRAPIAAIAARLYTVGCAWLHDRCRDAIVWHAARAESPLKQDSKASSRSATAAFRKDYSLESLQSWGRKFPSGNTVSREQRVYESQLAPEIKQLLSIYPVRKKGMDVLPGPLAPSSAQKSTKLAVKEVPADAWWNKGTVSDHNMEVREMEAAILVMKQKIDAFSLGRGIKRLESDCTSLLGLSFLKPNDEAQNPLPAGGEPLFENVYSPLAPRSPSSSRTSAANSPGVASAALHPTQMYPKAGSLGTPSGAFQFTGDYGMGQVKKLVRRLKGLQRSRSARTFVTENDVEEVQPGTIVVPEAQLHKWLEEVFRAMYSEGGQIVSVAATSVAMEMSNIEHLSMEMALRLSDLETIKDEEGRKHRLSLETQVCNRGMDLLKMLSDMRRQTMDMRDQTNQALALAADEARSKWEGRVKELEREIMITKANLNVVRNDMKESAMAAMAQVKHEAMKKLMDMRAGDQGGKQNTERIMDLEGELQKLKTQIRDNDQAVLKVRILYRLRMMAFQQRCQRMVDESLKDMNAMEKRKWEVQEETRLERDLLQQQLTATQADLADAQGVLASTGKDLTRTVRSKNKLMKWKLDRKAEFQQMKQRCTLLQAQKDRAEDKYKTLKDTRLSLKHGVEDSELALHANNDRSVAAVTRNASEIETINKPLNKKIADLQKTLAEERRMKAELMAQIEALQGQQRQLQAPAADEAGGTAPTWGAGLPGEMVYKGRYEDLKARHKQTTAEVQDLRYVVAGLFNAVPEVFATLDPGRLRNVGFIPQVVSSEIGVKDITWKLQEDPLRPHPSSHAVASHLPPGGNISSSPKKSSGGAGKASHRSSSAKPSRPKRPGSGDAPAEFRLEYRPTSQPTYRSSGVPDAAITVSATPSQLSPRGSRPAAGTSSAAREKGERPQRLFTPQGRPISMAQCNRKPVPDLGLRPASAHPQSALAGGSEAGGEPKKSRRPSTALPGSHAAMRQSSRSSRASGMSEAPAKGTSLPYEAASLQQQHHDSLRLRESAGRLGAVSPSAKPIGPWGR